MDFLYPVSYLFDYNAKFGDGKIYWGFDGPVCATFTWEEDTDYPIFVFYGEFQKYAETSDRIKETIREKEKKDGRVWSKKAEEEKERLEKEYRTQKLRESLGLI